MLVGEAAAREAAARVAAARVAACVIACVRCMSKPQLVCGSHWLLRVSGAVAYHTPRLDPQIPFAYCILGVSSTGRQRGGDSSEESTTSTSRPAGAPLFEGWTLLAPPRRADRPYPPGPMVTNFTYCNPVHDTAVGWRSHARRQFAEDVVEFPSMERSR